METGGQSTDVDEGTDKCDLRTWHSVTRCRVVGRSSEGILSLRLAMDRRSRRAMPNLQVHTQGESRVTRHGLKNLEWDVWSLGSGGLDKDTCRPNMLQKHTDTSPACCLSSQGGTRVLCAYAYRQATVAGNCYKELGGAPCRPTAVQGSVMTVIYSPVYSPLTQK
jgi:hypothetical protein